MKTLFAVLAVLALTVGCSKPKPQGEAIATGPLTLDETKMWLDSYDAAKASADAAQPYQQTASENYGAWISVTAQLNEAHNFPKENNFQIVKRNCRMVGKDQVCDRTVIKAPKPPDADKKDEKKDDKKPDTKEPAKK